MSACLDDFAPHPALRQFPVQDDCLQLGGVALTRLADRVGRTPFYAYERSHIVSRVARLRAALPPAVQLHYALQANPMPAVVQLLAGLVDGCAVACASEMKIALDAGLAPASVSLTGPAKSSGELRSAVAAGVLLHLASEEEMHRVVAAGDLLGITPRVAVRVNPDFELQGAARQFGVDADKVPAMLRRMARLGLDFHGFHLCGGAQHLSAHTLSTAQRACVRLGLELGEHVPSPVRMLTLGGGFGVPYFPGDRPLELGLVADNLATLVDLLRGEWPGTGLVLELGRYLVAEAGVYVCRVLERKQSHGQVFLITDGGPHHHLAPSGNVGQVVRKNFPVAIGNRIEGDARETVTVVGPLWTPLDLLADRMELARAEPGDLLVVLQSGAYGLTAGPTAFPGHLAPLEVLV